MYFIILLFYGFIVTLICYLQSINYFDILSLLLMLLLIETKSVGNTISLIFDLFLTPTTG